MKTRVLASLLVISALLNVAGLVFLIDYLKLKEHFKSVNREKNIIARNLLLTELAAPVPLTPERVRKHTFYSLVDGQPDTFAVVEPTISGPARDLTLLVYLHGMGGSYLEPFIYPDKESIAESIAAKFPSAILLSCDYRHEASWGSDAALADVTQNIRQMCQQYPVSRIVIMGTSMGGCIALTYACDAPPDIKAKLAGVVSAESTGELIPLYKECRLPQLKPSMIAAFGGTPEQVPEAYKSKSFLDNVQRFPAVPVAVLSARSDEIVPPAAQHHIVDAIRRRNLPAKLIEVDGSHRPLPGPAYIEGLSFVLSGGKSS